MITFAKINTISLAGVSVENVGVEVQFSAGAPSITIVGLAGKAVTESKERVRACILSLGLSLPSKRITINLTPANLTKDGNHYDLPIALGILTCLDIIKQEDITNYICIGELSLDGKVNYTPGILPICIYANSNNLGIICSESCIQEALYAGDGLNIIASSSFKAFIDHFRGTKIIQRPQYKDFHNLLNQPIAPTQAPTDTEISSAPPPAPNSISAVNGSKSLKKIQPSPLQPSPLQPSPLQPSISSIFDSVNSINLKDIKGQGQAKRAIEIAAAGGHNLLMIGRPGSGKSMLAKCFKEILPPLTLYEILEINTIYSVSGLLEKGSIITKRPFRAPHHTCSLASLVGGGRAIKPGEISLAHNGVLFMDEFAEFSSSTLNTLRQPMEDGHILISRAERHVQYQSKFQLIAAMNPCKCGYFGEQIKQCNRAPQCANDYRSKISGPISERIDMQVHVNPPDSFTLKMHEFEEESTATVAGRVMEAQKFQQKRMTSYLKKYHPQSDSSQENSPPPTSPNSDTSEGSPDRKNSPYQSSPYQLSIWNRDITAAMMPVLCKLDTETQELLNQAASKLKFSIREYNKIIKISRTIADLRKVEEIQKTDILEAIQLRTTAVQRFPPPDFKRYSN